MVMSIGCLMLAGMLGCCNCITRMEGNGAPYVCAPYPYYCTAETWPGVILDYGDHYCGTKVMLMRRLWLFCVVDEMFEVALDTVFLPVDLTSLYFCSDERRKKIAEDRERRKKRADVASCCPIQVIQPPPEAVPTIQVLPVGNSAEGADSAMPAEVDLAASAETVPAPTPANKQGVEP